MRPGQRLLVLPLTLVVALLLSIWPLPFSWLWLRPEFTALAVIFWSGWTPARFGVGSAWLTGLVLDGFQGVTLGQNALGLAIIAYVCSAIQHRIRQFSVLQQVGVVFVLVGLHLLVGHWVQGLANGPSRQMDYLGAAMSSALIWPAVLLPLLALSRRDTMGSM